METQEKSLAKHDAVYQNPIYVICVQHFSLVETLYKMSQNALINKLISIFPPVSSVYTLIYNKMCF